MKTSQSLLGAAFALARLLTPGLAAPSTEPVNPAASESARNLLTYLVTVASDGSTLSGQQDLADVDWVTQNVGKTPSILGVDFMDYSPSRVEFGASGSTVEDAISFAGQGGIITFCWHWGSPSGTLNTDEQPWYSNFYTEATSFDLGAAMSENSSDYDLILRDIDAIAEELKRLQDADIPVLFRPLHEADGGWFWWGAKGAEPCKALYNLLFDRMTNEHGLNNLIWVWNSVSSDWYPGNDVVDIVTIDVYADEGDHSSQSDGYNQLKSLSGDSKLIALGEVGNIPDPDEMRNDGAAWAYWVTWNGDFIEGETNNPSDFKQQVFNSEYVLTLDEISGWN